jgi:prephenate dehydratase
MADPDRLRLRHAGAGGSRRAQGRGTDVLHELRPSGPDRLRAPLTVIVGYPGPEGSHSGAASSVLAPEGARTVGLPSFSAVVEAAVEAEVAMGVLPIENSLMGPIAETHDLLYESPLSIVREATLPIRHCIVGTRGASIDDVRVVRSHPAAFDQCRELFHRWHVKRIATATTADAAREVSESADPTHAAVASLEAAEAYGLDVLADDVGDSPGAFTRFVAIAPYTRIDGGEGWRTALSFVTDHRPGALFHALAPFARHGLNLVQLVSRPLPNSRWRYRFDVVLDGHVFDPEVSASFTELRGLTRELRVFGSYAAEREH